jgi:hypothetical protein
MTDSAELELSYRRWLRCYPRSFRRDHETEILGVLMAGAAAGRGKPELIERLDLLRSALWMRLRPSVSTSERSGFGAVKLMYVGAVTELAVALTVFATVGEVKSQVAARNPGMTQAQSHAVVASALHALVVAAVIAVGFWLWMAWANGRGHRWTRIAFAVFFAMNTGSLLHGVQQGSAVYARADLAVGAVLWLVELAVIALLFEPDFRRIRHCLAGASR